MLALFDEAVDGLRKAAAVSPLSGVGVDAWGVDYALLDDNLRILGLPFHYRDRRTEGMIARAHARVPRDELYAVTGIQTMPINTIFQLLADEGSAALDAAERIALIPDLFAYWLSGEFANEATIASTTGLLDARGGNWARPLVERLGLPAAPFSGDPLEAGATLGELLPAHGLSGLPAHLVDARQAAAGPRPRRAAGARGRRARHSVGVRRRSGPHAGRGDPVVRHLVPAGRRARRTRPDLGGGRLQPHQ